ncbi:DUF3467 domain-containing protein [uncultured Bacteroides sp.]|uniref:DUF3467 domain-containing protein n=1 Tax=uncultured Bacteroides sp. TaxID=162156 RepID=UPI002AAB223E|nr:DUF3467 domain-containing protein [uncultured Bacteroides sp.]
MNEQEKENQLQIELDAETAQGKYANLALITHSSSEFVLDFACVMPGVSKAHVQSRVVMAPEHAKRLFRALHENLKKYEESYGSISLMEEHSGLPIANFKGEA